MQTLTLRLSSVRKRFSRRLPRRRNWSPGLASRNARSRSTSFPDEILKEAKALAGDRIVAALLTPGKLDREGAVAAITEEIGKKLVEKFGAEKVTEFVLKDAFYYIQKESVRGLIMNQGKRLDGRDFETVRPIVSEVGILPRAHGSALFQRGETQAVTLCTLGTGEDAQEFDSLYRRRQREEIHPALQLPELLRRRNRPHQRSGSARDWPRRIS